MNRTRNRGGYTLLEVLTVITLLLIVTAIIYPAFATARFKAWETTCVSQMRQIALAYQMYRQDWDGKDTGTSLIDFGLPNGEHKARAKQYVPGYDIDWRIVKCPNRWISGDPPGRTIQNQSAILDIIPFLASTISSIFRMIHPGPSYLVHTMIRRSGGEKVVTGVRFH